jgi:hypothetical protein
MVDKKIEEEAIEEEVISRMNQIKKAAGAFRANVSGLMKDMNVESKDWHFNVQSHEEGVTVDVAIKLLITKKK